MHLPRGVARPPGAGVASAVLATLMLAALAIDAPLTAWASAPARADAFYRATLVTDPLFAIVIGLFAVWSLRDVRRPRCGWRHMIVGIATPLLLHLPFLHGLKFLIGRARPKLDAGPFSFAPLSFGRYADSFPSGHATTLALVALLVGVYFPRTRGVLVVWALVEGAKRVTTRYHWPSDVFGGYLLAVLVFAACWRVFGTRCYGAAAVDRGPAT